MAAPYARGEQAAARQVVSQRERDLAALDLARRKGVMLAQLAALAADDRLHPESVPVVEWFRAEVQAARGGGRLGELAALLPQAGIRRRRWWQGQPAGIEAAGWDDDGGEDQDEDDGNRPPARRAAALMAAVLGRRRTARLVADAPALVAQEPLAIEAPRLTVVTQPARVVIQPRERNPE